MASVYDEITRLETAKSDIETAIETCGVDVPDTELISTYASYIRQIPSAVFSELNVDSAGGVNQYIESIKQTAGKISTTLGGLVTSSKSGLVPLADASGGTIDNQSTDWVLTSNNGTIGWYQLPVNSFKNDNTTYTLSGALSGNTFGTKLTPSSGTAYTAIVPAMTAATASAAGKAGLVPAPAAGDNGKVLSGAGTWISFPTLSVTNTGSGNAVTSVNVSGHGITVAKDSTFSLSGHTHNTSNVTALTNYTKGTSTEKLETTDTLNAALAKLENKADQGVSAYNWVISVTTEDTDTYINKWQEIVNFLDGVSSTTLNGILANYVTLNTAQTVSATKTFSAQQKFTVASGTAPFTVTSTTKVTNLNADLLDGHNASTGADADTVAVRDGNGYLYTSYVNTNISNQDNLTVSSVYYSNGDNFLRKCSVSRFATAVTTPLYVTALGTNGNYVTWTKNGTTNNLTVPYATKSSTSNLTYRLCEHTALSDRTNTDSSIIAPKSMPLGLIIRFKNATGAASSFTWNTIVSMNAYAGSSSSGAGYRHEFLFSDSNNHSDGTFYVRNGVDDTWNAWVKVLTESNITKANVGLGNVQNTAFYERIATVNGTDWQLAGTVNSSRTFAIYAPTTAGTSGQVLISSGGTPSWTNQSNLSVGNADYAISAPAAANYGETESTTKIKIKINSTISWMLSFVVTLYQGYKSSKIMVSGYNYGSSYWYAPEAVLLGDSNGDTSIPVYFGYDSAWNLWVGFDGGNYTGVSVSDVTNGYSQISSFKDLFTISNVSSLTTLQKTVTATNSVNHSVSATTASKLGSSTVGGTYEPIYLNSGTATKSTSYAKAIKAITRSGTTFTYTCLDDTTGTFSQQDNNTTYAAGTGLALSNNTFRTTVPRVAKSCNSIPGANTWVLEEYSAGTAYNLPTNSWYHIYTAEGSDTKYATQLALGMTTNAAYYRNYNNGTWSSWYSLINTDSDTTYTFSSGTNCFYVTPSGGSQQTITVTPSITNNITGSGTSDYLAKFNGTNTITSGPALGSSTTTYLRNDGTWATPTDLNHYPIRSYTSGLQISSYSGSTNCALYVPIAGATTLGVVRGFHRTSGTATGTKTTSASDAPAVNSRSTTSGRYYGVETDASGYMFVNVPWSNSTYSFSNNAPTLAWGTTSTIGTVGGVDLTVTMPANPNTNTNYYHTPSYSSGLSIATGTGVNALYVPYATASQAGVVTTAAQTFAGEKTFNSTIYSSSIIPRTTGYNLGSSAYPFTSAYVNAVYLDPYYTSGTLYITGVNTAPDSTTNTRLYTALYAKIQSNSSSTACAIYAPGGFYESSDERLKCIIKPVKVNLDDLENLRKVYYLWKNNTSELQLGVIAQDVQKLYPELVTVDSDTGYLTLAYDKLSVIALGAIDQVYNMIKDLRKENEKLKDRISKLEKLLK